MKKPSVFIYCILPTFAVKPISAAVVPSASIVPSVAVSSTDAEHVELEKTIPQPFLARSMQQDSFQFVSVPVVMKCASLTGQSDSAAGKLRVCRGAVYLGAVSDAKASATAAESVFSAAVRNRGGLDDVTMFGADVDVDDDDDADADADVDGADTDADDDDADEVADVAPTGLKFAAARSATSKGKSHKRSQNKPARFTSDQNDRLRDVKSWADAFVVADKLLPVNAKSLQEVRFSGRFLYVALQLYLICLICV